MKTKIIEIALGEYGIKETQGSGNTPKVLEYFAESGHGWVKDDTNYAWCSVFANYVAKMSGLKYTKNLMARSWLTVGQETKKPEIGDVCVFWRNSINGTEGHVAFYIREDGENILCLGGNQADEVNISRYPKSRLLAYMDITKESKDIKASPGLAKGSTGTQVKALQKALGVTVDGIFGPITERVLKAFQAKHGVPVTGIADKATLKALNTN